MEVICLLLSMVLLVLALAIRIFAFKHSSHSSAKNLPPGSLGWPIFGETLDFLFAKPEKFVSDRMKRYSSDIFKTKILGEETAVICGPGGHKFLFSNEQKLFTAFRTHAMQKIFRSYQAAAPAQIPREAESKILRSPGFLKPEALVRYLGKMDSITQLHMQTYWEGKDEVKAFALAKTLTLSLACRFFLGSDDPERIARLVSNFDDLTLGMHSIPLNVYGTTFYRANKAAAAIRKELRVIIDEKRAGMSKGAQGHDILCHMILATDPSGKHMAEAEIADKIMGLLVAGYSTVATAMTFFMKNIYWTVSTTNKDPQYFPDPEKFDPSRYDDGKVFPPFTFVPFGGGPRMCPGKEYARLAILTFVHNVVKRFRWEVAFPAEKIAGDMMPTPEKGLPIRLQSRPAERPASF
ncbi:hypothetical protein POTOM_041415 [Populus tomentosa]|uniref:Uncharacterized protein n=1 Tax=Populus tomentosa TaxID=118781 RepID=A0A8X7YUH1_POPTO|nr:hypothetical protein POTOM_041415 [Populus tomentosa]